MSTRADILEQIVEEYLIHEGYFVQHNVRYRPNPTHKYYNSKKDSVHSDVDVIGVNPKKSGFNRVMVVNCKSWQQGFDAAKHPDRFDKERQYLEGINWERDATGTSQKRLWKRYREFCSPKWAEALVDKVEELTGVRKFTHVMAVSWLKSGKEEWENDRRMQSFLNGNRCKILTFEEMASAIVHDLGKTLAPSEVGRLLQMFKAARIPEFDDWVNRLGEDRE